MSTFNDIDITCEKCGAEFRGTIWTAVNARQDPELKDILLGGELNMVMCPECANVAYQDHFVLYQDPSAQLIAYVYPPSEESKAEELKVLIKKGFQEAQAVYEKEERRTYEPVLVFGLESLVEMMQEEEERAEQSQIAEAVCKEAAIPYTLLSPFDARRHRLPRVLPGVETPHPSRADLLKGVETLLQKNDRLSLYAQLRDTLQATPAWQL